MFDEKPEDLAELADEYHELYIPADGKERFLVGTLVNNEWRLRRMRRVEAELWNTRLQHLHRKEYRRHRNLYFWRRLRNRLLHLRAPPTGRQFLRARLPPHLKRTR